MKALDGTWRGASGATNCRIGDFSLGGCFVQSLAMPQQNELTQVTVSVDDQPVTLSGTVVYVEPGMGFAVKFQDLSDAQMALLARLVEPSRVPSASD